MSYKPEVQTDNSGKWYDNALRFETEEEAIASAKDLMRRWFAVRAVRASYSDDTVNYKLDLETYVMEPIAA
jgi:hypothetical protein